MRHRTDREPDPVRIDLMIDALLPTEYVPGLEARLEAYRRLAAATTPESIDDVIAEWEDRFGDVPDSAKALLSVARLRSEALRIGVTEIVENRNEIKISPVTMRASQEVRLERLVRGALLRGDSVYLPSGFGKSGSGGDSAMVIADFLRTMWPASEYPSPVPNDDAR